MIQHFNCWVTDHNSYLPLFHQKHRDWIPTPWCNANSYTRAKEFLFKNILKFKLFITHVPNQSTENEKFNKTDFIVEKTPKFALSWSLKACVPLSDVWRLEIGVILTFLTQQCFKGQILGDNSSHFLIAQLCLKSTRFVQTAQYSTPRYSSESKSCFRMDSGFWLLPNMWWNMQNDRKQGSNYSLFSNAYNSKL